MKAITLTQPWATLVAIGAKRIETRSRRMMHRGQLAIHAAKGFPEYAQQACTKDPFLSVLDIKPGSVLEFGVVLATCDIVDVLPSESIICIPGIFDDYPELDTPQERAFGDYAPGRWCYVLENVKLLDRPVPAKGSQTLGWEWVCA